MPCQPPPSRRAACLLSGGLASLLALSACGGDPAATPSSTPATTPATAPTGRLQVVTTVAPLTSIVAAVAGDRVTITGLVPEGTNSHTFEPPPSAARVLSEADVVFVNGLKLEEPTKELAQRNAKPGSELVEFGPKLLPESDYIYDFSFPKEEGKPNPHLWTDPTYAIRYAQVAHDTLARRDPAGSATYDANLAAFTKQATALSDALKTDQATIPAGKKELLTYHDAYAYFAKTYDWKVIGAIQPENFEDPTPKEVAELIDQVKAEQVPAIFGSEVFPSKVLEQIGKEAGVRYVDVLRDDDLPGAPGETEHSWQGLMRFDYVTMVEALGGQAPTLAAVDTAPVTPDRATYPQ